MSRLRPIALFLAALAMPAAAHATTITDPVGDFAPGYLGAAADLDVTAFSVTFDAATGNFTLGATMAGAINPATAGVYIIGVNTGTGPSAPFAAIGAPNVRFNQTVRVNKDGTGSVGATAVSVTISGNSLSAIVPLSILPSTGFTADQYGWNLWPRTGVGAGTFVTDFAPNDGTIAAVPEPAAWSMMVVGIGAAGAMMRRGRRATVGKARSV